MCFYINKNEFYDKQSFFINKVYFICLNSLVALNTKITKRAFFFYKTMQKVIMATCCFISFNAMFLHEIKYVQSLKVMST